MYRKNIKLLSIFNFLGGFSLFAPLAIIYFAKVSGSFTLGTSIFGITMLSSAIFEIPTGIWSDKVGRKNTLILGCSVRVIAFIFYALGFSYFWLLVGAIFEGMSNAFYSGNGDAFLYDTLNDSGLSDKFAEYKGKVNSSEQGAMAISAIIGGALASISFSYLLWFSVIPQVIMLLISFNFTEPLSRKQSENNTFSHLKEAVKLFVVNKKLRLLSMASIINFSLGELKWQFGSAFTATVWPLWAIGISKSLPSIGASISFFFSGKLIKKFKAINILFFDSIYGKISSLIAYLIPSIYSPLILTSSSLLFGVCMVSENTLMQKEFSEHQRATMGSLNSLAGSICYAILSIFLGSLADSFGPAKALVTFTILGIPVIWLYWLMFRTEKHELRFNVVK